MELSIQNDENPIIREALEHTLNDLLSKDQALESHNDSTKFTNLPRFSDIVGNEDAISALYECTVARASLPPFIFTGCRKIPTSVLLYGPPGTGTLM